MLDKFFKESNLVKDTANLEKLCELHEMSKPDQLFIAVAQGKVVLGQDDVAKIQNSESQSNSWLRFFTFGKKKQKIEELSKENPVIDKKKILPLTESNLYSKYTLCDCCQPIPGDAVMGYVDESNRVIVHKLQCSVAQRLKANQGNRIVGVRWEMGNFMQFEASISLRGIDKPGMLNKMTDVISREHNLNIHKLEIECNDGLFESKIRLYVHDTSELKKIIDSLKKIPDIEEVARI